MTLPKWSTPERQRQMVKLWAELGNRCFQGHAVCPIKEHYQQVKVHTGILVQKVLIQAVTRSGNPRYTAKGNKLWATAWTTPKTVTATTLIEGRPYEAYVEELIEDWKAADASRRAVEWQMEWQRIHGIGDHEVRHRITAGRAGKRRKTIRAFVEGGWSQDYTMVRGKLRHHDPITAEQWRESLPLFEIAGHGVNPATNTITALVLIPGLAMPVHLWVDVSKAAKPSRNRRRKAERYGIPLPTEGELCKAAVLDWRTKHHLE